MKKVYKLTESDLHEIIENSVNNISHILNLFKTNKITISNNEDSFELYDAENDEVYYVDYGIESDQHEVITRSNNYDIPDDYDIEGDWNFTYMSIYDEDENLVLELDGDDSILDKIKSYVTYDGYVNTADEYEDSFDRYYDDDDDVF